MAIKVKCACGRDLVAKDEMAGKKVRCPSCKEILVVAASPVSAGAAPKRPGGAPPPPSNPRRPQRDEGFEDDDEDEEEKKPKSRKIQARVKGLQRASIGLLLHLIRFCILLGIVGGYLVVAILMLMASLVGPEFGVIALLIAVILGWFAVVLFLPTTILGIVGNILGLWLPPNAKAKKPLVMALSMTGACVPLMIIPVPFMAAMGMFTEFSIDTLWVSGRFALFAFLAAVICWIGAESCFFVYLRNMCFYVEDQEQGDACNALVVLWVLMILLPFPLWWVLVLLVSMLAGGPIALIVGFAMYVGVMLAWVRILLRVIKIITSIRKVIAANVS